MKVDLTNYYNQLNHKSVLLAFKGYIFPDFFNCMLRMVEEKLHRVEIKYKTRKKIFNILVEVFQNVYHYFHSVNFDNFEENSIVFLLCKSGRHFNIFTGNHVANESVDELKKRIDKINAMDEEELKETYRFNLKNDLISKEGRAGLGIMDIVRKSGTKIDYSFEKVDKYTSFFSLKISVA